jgi:acyl carrier protein
MRGRNTKSEDAILRERIQAEIDSGELKESDDSSIAFKVLHFDSLDIVELMMILEEAAGRGVEAEPQRDVGDLLRLLKTLEFREQRRNRNRE